ncbi:hypothetical protein L1887_02353 [Cichorium endivia]|nr:hypothetical protein L1887_02353 [Cichorium endivia]
MNTIIDIDVLVVEIKIGEKYSVEKSQEMGNSEKGTRRSSRKWNGGTSTRLFNKMVRDRNRRRGMLGGKRRSTERKLSCPKSKTSCQISKSRNSEESLDGQIGGTSDDIQSLKVLGSQIGFSWGKEMNQAKGETVVASSG